MKYLFISFIIALTACETQPEKPQFTAHEILEFSKRYHDPNGNWGQTDFLVHIQEPRLMNLLRYSKLRMDNLSGNFKLVRDSEAGLVERMIDENGTPSVLLNGSPEITDEQKEEFRLDEQRNFGYQSFYELMYGLPMSLRDDVIKSIGDPQNLTYEDEEVYSVGIELEEAMISNNWELLFSKANYSLVGLKIHPNDPQREGEFIVFDGRFSFNGITIPRFRHWYESKSEKYSGSDVIVRALRKGELAK